MQGTATQGTATPGQFEQFFTRIARRLVGVREVVPVSGGCIQPAYAVTLASGETVFAKAGTPDEMGRLKAEAGGLKALAEANAIRVPQVFAAAGEGRHSYLVMEHLKLVPGTPASFARLGRELAALHRAGATGFGFERDNYIGATPQSNVIDTDWPRFFGGRRLMPQLALAESGVHAGGWIDEGRKLAEAARAFFPGHAPTPSLLHGDLWGGNAGFLEDGTPVLYDPAVYYGDREADLAMTELFGGFPAEFFAAYREAWPLDAGYVTRRDFYNLYHVLNHANLFGGNYVAQARDLILRLTATIR
ncbi:MAG: fructosamine kinase family protein [Burkholderiales bacterium]|nr:fructosamine kinase family protein [Burkholderiales bacterium]